MPRLLLFAACEKLIVDQANVLSLISLLQELNIQVPADATLPAELKLAPMTWTILSIWEQEPGDQDKDFEQRIAITLESGEMVTETPIAAFQMKTPQHRNIGMVVGIPIEPKSYYIRTWLKEKNSLEWGNEVGRYPLKVNRITPTQIS
jgi:hypothetical protein